MRRLLLTIACGMMTAACSSSVKVPCSQPGTMIVNPRFPDGGVDDAGMLAPGVCQSVCSPHPAAGCNLEQRDGGTILYCIPCFG